MDLPAHPARWLRVRKCLGLVDRPVWMGNQECLVYQVPKASVAPAVNRDSVVSRAFRVSVVHPDCRASRADKATKV